MAKVINSLQSTVGSPYCIYSLSMTPSNRTSTTVDISWTLTAHLKSSESSMGWSLTAYVYAGNNSQNKSLKGTEWWTGTSSHSISGSFTVTGLSSSTTSITTALQIVSGAPENACQLNKTSGLDLTIPILNSGAVVFNGTTINKIIFNGTTVSKLVFDGIVVKEW